MALVQEEIMAKKPSAAAGRAIGTRGGAFRGQARLAGCASGRLGTRPRLEG
jgi:hypothetical protein